MSLKPVVLEPRMTRKPPFSVEVPGSVFVKGETTPRRNVKSPDKLVSSPEEGIETVFDIVKRGREKFGDLNAMGSRKLLKTHHEMTTVKKVIDGKVEEVDKEWAFYEMSGYQYITFKEYEILTLQIGAGLRKLGLEKNDRVHMFAATSPQWLSMAHGTMSQTMAVVTAYDTLGEEGLRHSLVTTKAKAIFLEPHLLHTFIQTLQAIDSIQYIILNADNDDDVRAEDLEVLKSTHDHITVLKYEDLRRMGEENPVDPIPPTREDLCCIMFTSGSSGAPKGVPIKHKAVVAAIAGADSTTGDYIGQGDYLLTYLPLAHIFEFAFENACIFWGATMGYGSIRTLSQMNCKNCLGDIQEFKPTLMPGVPAVWESIKKGIIANVNAAGPMVRTMFWAALYAKQFLMSRGLPGSGILDAVVFNKIKAATGGRLKFCMNGAAPIAKETQEFFSFAVSPLVSGYGLTETSAMGMLCDAREWNVDGGGTIPSCIEIKLVDFPEASYFATNKPNPQGEIWIRGDAVLEQYYENPKDTADAIAPGGWFKTGDIGEFSQNGHLRVIDRKKNLVKTLNGEYIALEKLESIYRSVTAVANICVYASVTETNPVAIIVPAEPALIKLAQSLGVGGYGIGDLVHNKRIQREVLKQMQAVGRKAGLAGMEILVGAVLSDEEWTPQNNMLTPTTKLKRRAIFERYRGDIERAYRESKG